MRSDPYTGEGTNYRPGVNLSLWPQFLVLDEMISLERMIYGIRERRTGQSLNYTGLSPAYTGLSPACMRYTVPPAQCCMFNVQAPTLLSASPHVQKLT